MGTLGRIRGEEGKLKSLDLGEIRGQVDELGRQTEGAAKALKEKKGGLK